MGDSDDEYDRKRRDKFRGERSGTDTNYNRSDRRDERRSGGREEYNERPRGRPDYREYRSPRERGYSPEQRPGPPMKRMRQDWDEPRPRYGRRKLFQFYFFLYINRLGSFYSTRSIWFVSLWS